MIFDFLPEVPEQFRYHLSLVQQKRNKVQMFLLQTFHTWPTLDKHLQNLRKITLLHLGWNSVRG